MVWVHARMLPTRIGMIDNGRKASRIPSRQICIHSLVLRRYSVGCITRGAGRLTSTVEATGRTAMAGCISLIVSSELNGIVGTSSACTDSAVTTWVVLVGLG